MDSADVPEVEAWARAANAVLFIPDGSVRAPDMTILLSADGESDPASALPYPPDAIARRARTLKQLQGVKPQPPASMPPAIGEAELVLRSPVDTLRRALALLYVAVKALREAADIEPIPAGQREHNPVGFAVLTPGEQAFLESGVQDEATAAAMTWRYEAANTLLWTLGVEAACISSSEQLVDINDLWESIADRAQSDDAAHGLRLRPAGEILDALDRIWREHWIARQAYNNGLSSPGLNLDILMERHAALNWLTGFQNDFGTAWDDIDTPT